MFFWERRNCSEKNKKILSSKILELKKILGNKIFSRKKKSLSFWNLRFFWEYFFFEKKSLSSKMLELTIFLGKKKLFGKKFAIFFQFQKFGT